MKKIISLLMCFFVLLSVLPISVYAEEETQVQVPIYGNVDGNYYSVNDVLYETDFEDATIGELPEGWSGGGITPFAWSMSGGSVSAAVADIGGEYGKVLNLGSTNADLFVSAPEINTRNYIYETTVKITGRYAAAVGPANSMQGGAMNADGAVAVAIRTKTATSPHRYFSKAINGSQGITESNFTLPFDKPLNGEIVKFKVISLNGVNYFFYNNTFVVSFPQPAGDETTDCVGFYGSNEWFNVIDLKVTGITPVEYTQQLAEIEGKKVLLGKDLINTNFDEYEIGTLPEGMEVGTPAHFWNGGGPEPKAEIVELSGEGKALFAGGFNRDAVVHFGDIDAKNYIFEIKVRKNGGEKASAGIVNLMPGGIKNSETAMLHVVYTNPENQNVPFISSKNTSNYISKNKVNISGFEYTKPSSGEVYTLKLVSLNGTTYFYYNDNLAVSYKQPEWNLEKDGLGFFFCGEYSQILEVKATEIYELDYAVDTATLILSDSDEVSMGINLKLNKNNQVYVDNYSDGYEYSDDAPVKFGVIIGEKTGEEITVETKGVTNVLFTECTESENYVNFNYVIENVPERMKDKYYSIRPYAMVGFDYYYCEEMSYCPAYAANNIYLNATDDNVKNAIEEAFADSKVFTGNNSKQVTFTVFADFHYKEGMYISSISDLNAIFDRAHESGSAFVLSAGDITNDMKGSPELVKAFKENKYNLPAYNVYGNHELESAGNTMALVTPTLTNDENVVWGTADGKIAPDGSIGYYYFENSGFRVIGLDNNYSYNPTAKIWEHNKPASWSSPNGNLYYGSLGPEQLKWLENVLVDAANQNIPCIVFAHHDYSEINGHAADPDKEEVRKIYAKVNSITPGTVLMSINGHIHTDTVTMEDGVLYFDVNTTRNLWWQYAAMDNYNDSQTYMREYYDDEGNLIEIKEIPVTQISGYKQSAFSEDPLSAVVTVNENGIINIEGMETDWLYDFVPSGTYARTVPYISSGTYYDNQLCHIWSDEYEANETHHWLPCTNDACNGLDNSECKNYGEHIDNDGNGDCDICKPTKPEYEQGDVNGDGSVDAADLALLKKVIAKLTPIDAAEVKYPNVDGQGTEPDAADLALLKKIIAKLV